VLQCSSGCWLQCASCRVLFVLLLASPGLAVLVWIVFIRPHALWP